MKKQKGVSLLESLAVVGLVLVGIVSASIVWNSNSQKQTTDKLAFELASEQIQFAQALDQYVKDTWKNEVVYEVTIDDLINKGYILKKSSVDTNVNNDGVDVLGYDLIGIVTSPFGFPQNVGVFQTGEVDEKKAKQYGLYKDGKLNKKLLESVYLKASLITSKRNIDLNSYAIIDRKMKSGYSKVNIDTNSRYDYSIYSYYPTYESFSNGLDLNYATFTNLQINPGYWVLRYEYYYPSSKFGSPINQYTKLKSLGYSDYCPGDSNINAHSSTYTYSDFVKLGVSGPYRISDSGDYDTLGELSGSFYACLPSTKMVADTDEKNIEINQIDIGKTEIKCTNNNREKEGYINERAYAKITAATFDLGNNKYSIVTKGSSYDLNCQSAGGGAVIFNAILQRGELPNKIRVLPSENYAPEAIILDTEIKNIITEKIKLK